jgi:basic amino acid/polyamine antiporter, APA family
MPRSGGDFVFTSRLLHPLIGASVGGAGIFVFITVCGTNSATFGLLFLPQLFNQLGVVFSSPGLTSFGTTLGTPVAAFVTTVLLIVASGCVVSLGLKRVSQVMWALFAIGMIGFISMLVIELTNSREQFISVFNSASAVTAGGNAYQQIIDAAKSQGFTPGVSFMGILLAVPYCAMVYWGFTSAVYPGGELKDASKTLTRSTLITLVVGAVLLIGIWEAVKRLVGLDFMQAQNWLAINHADVYGGISTAPTLMSYYSSVLAGKSIFALLIPLSYLCWIAGFNLAYYVVISRVIFAMSFDRLLPEWLAETKAGNVPLNAVIVSAIGMIVLAGAQVFYSGILAGIFNATLAIAFLYLLVSIAAMILPFVKPELYQASPKVAGDKLGGVPVISLIGGLSSLFIVFIIYMCFSRPDLIGPASVQALVFTVIMFGWGIIAYFIARASFKKSTGMDLNLSLKEIPPE